MNFEELDDILEENESEVDPDYEPPPDEVFQLEYEGFDNDHFAQLRKRIDGNDSFMRSGHQIHGPRRYRRTIPEWTKSDTKIQEVLLRAFPKLQTDEKQRERAGRWMRVIHLYWRCDYSQTDLALELRVSRTTVMNLLQRIKRTAEGLRADGSGERGGAGPGMRGVVGPHVLWHVNRGIINPRCPLCLPTRESSLKCDA